MEIRATNKAEIIPFPQKEISMPPMEWLKERRELIEREKRARDYSNQCKVNRETKEYIEAIESILGVLSFVAIVALCLL